MNLPKLLRLNKDQEKKFEDLKEYYRTEHGIFSMQGVIRSLIESHWIIVWPEIEKRRHPNLPPYKPPTE